MKTEKQLTSAEVAEVLKTVTLRFPEAVIKEAASAKRGGKKCYFVCDEWKCEPNPGGTVHCECVRGRMVCK